MRNSILCGVIVSSMILGGIIGGSINDIQRNSEVEAAWEDISISVDGRLIANPAYYALHPDELASGDTKVIIVDDHAEGIRRLVLENGQ